MAQRADPLVFADGLWSPNGTSLSDAAQKANGTRLGERMKRVLEVVISLGVTSPPDVSELLDIDVDTAGRYLRRLTDSGLITRVERGRYSPENTVRLSDSRINAAQGLEVTDCDPYGLCPDRVTTLGQADKGGQCQTDRAALG